MLYRIQHSLVYISKKKYPHSSDSRTRGQHRFFQERIQDDNYKNLFFPRTVRDWNQLPARVVSAISLEEFRSLLRGCPLCLTERHHHALPFIELFTGLRRPQFSIQKICRILPLQLFSDSDMVATVKPNRKECAW